MFPADGLNREGDMSTLEDAFAADKRKEQLDNRNAMPFCPGCRKYHREGHQFCGNYPLTSAEFIAASQNLARDFNEGNAANTDPNNLRAAPRMPILEEREKEYGSFKETAQVSQTLKSTIEDQFEYRKDFPASELHEAIDLICTKLARLSQNPSHKDSWKDIAGYAMLAFESLK